MHALQEEWDLGLEELGREDIEEAEEDELLETRRGRRFKGWLCDASSSFGFPRYPRPRRSAVPAAFSRPDVDPPGRPYTTLLSLTAELDPAKDVPGIGGGSGRSDTTPPGPQPCSSALRARHRGRR
ncbi:hypothetical protein C8F04DRAFT_1188017 [Mycena alexandri]|uniref:Uncharacterized protein n=1 Tax=Mycena alexandri TaxID=1745969 RepID=A0AAD6SKQ2_9AGAR|nr:hypothetical protein C8F04DRAFT_1188017 [Mycena alexandri]